MILTYFTDTNFLMGKQKVAPITGWDKAASQHEAWAVFCTVFLEDEGIHPATYEIFLLLEETPGVSLRLRGKARQQPTFLTSILRLIQQEFNKNFLQALERRKRVRWPNFENLQRALAAGSFRPDLVALLGGGSITREPPTPTCSSLPPGISNTPSVGRHYPNAPGAEQEGKSVA